MSSIEKILIVEDSSMTRSMIRAAIEDVGEYETIEAENGFDALKLLPIHAFSLIITDINMPGINGLELISFAKGDPRFKDTPIIIISTEKSEEDRGRGMKLGANAYLTKPFSAEDIQKTVSEFLGK